MKKTKEVKKEQASQPKKGLVIKNTTTPILGSGSDIGTHCQGGGDW